MKKTQILTLLLFFLTWFSSPSNLAARSIISGISENEINIDSNFNGKQILLFGAKADAGDVIIAVRGPKKNFLVTKKEKLLGIWYNGQRIKFKNTPSFYSLFSSTYEHNYSPETIKLFDELEIGKGKLKFDVAKEIDDGKRNEFYIQLVKNLENKNLYSSQTDNITFLDESLFKVLLNFPKNIAHGTYTVEIYLVEDGSLLSFQSIPVYVYQVGLGAKIANFAYHESFFYGLIAVTMALVFGWFVNFIFARFFGK